MNPSLSTVLEWIQPDIITFLQTRLAQPYSQDILIQARESALAILDGQSHALVCVQNPDRPEKDYLCASYTSKGDIYTIGTVAFLWPEQVVLLRQKGVLPPAPPPEKTL